ncbi:hypothetical protein [Comamonas testosteroni]|uniref:hypothetical protein n=1 Tax=Comamonas testosteroni TaxID=285 RepID=UPI00391B50D9
MTPDTLLLRQIHPSFIQDGRVTSQAFRPTPKDEFLLSVDDGDRVSAEASRQRFVANLACKSVGVQAVSHTECAAQALAVIEDGNPHPEHCSVDFTAFDKKTIEKKSKLLRAQAETRGWLFREAVA